MSIKRFAILSAIIVILGSLLGGCEDALRIQGRELGSLPDKTTYIQYIDHEIDFTGGTIRYLLGAGSSSEDKMTHAVILEAVDFNTPGVYTVTLDPFDDNPPTFEVTVIPIDEAPGLDTATAEQAKQQAIADTSKDQAKIIQVINDRFNQHYTELLADNIEYIEQHKDDYTNYNERMSQYQSTTFNCSPVYRNFQIQDETAIVRMTEYTYWCSNDVPYQLYYSRQTINLEKNNGDWTIIDLNNLSPFGMWLD